MTRISFECRAALQIADSLMKRAPLVAVECGDSTDPQLRLTVRVPSMLDAASLTGSRR